MRKASDVNAAAKAETGKARTHGPATAGPRRAAIHPRQQRRALHRRAETEGPTGKPEHSAARREGPPRSWETAEEIAQKRVRGQQRGLRKENGNGRRATTMRETSGTRAREAPASACQAVKRTEPCRANLAPERQEDLAGPQRRGGGDEGGGWGGHAAPADRDQHTLSSGPDADAGPALRLPLPDARDQAPPREGTS